MNPETNRFEHLSEDQVESLDQLRRKIQSGLVTDDDHLVGVLLRPNGEPIPQHWTQFQIGECVIIKDYTFKVAYIGETSILFEPVGIPDLGDSR